MGLCLLVLKVGDAVNFGNVEESGQSFHDFAQPAVELTVLGNQHFDALRQCFMAPSQARVVRRSS